MTVHLLQCHSLNRDTKWRSTQNNTAMVKQSVEGRMLCRMVFQWWKNLAFFIPTVWSWYLLLQHHDKKNQNLLNGLTVYLNFWIFSSAMMLTQFAGLWPRGRVYCKPESLYIQCGGSSKNFIVSNKNAMKCYKLVVIFWWLTLSTLCWECYK